MVYRGRWLQRVGRWCTEGGRWCTEGREVEGREVVYRG